MDWVNSSGFAGGECVNSVCGTEGRRAWAAVKLFPCQFWR